MIEYKKIMEIKVEKVYQSPCTPPTEAVYLVKFTGLYSETPEPEYITDISLLRELETRVVKSIFGDQTKC